MKDDFVTKDFCEIKHATTVEKLDRIIKALEGNGQPGIILKVDRHNRIINALVWAVGVVISALIAKLTKVI